MTDAEILDEIKKAMALLEDKTYSPYDFRYHLLTFIKDNFLPPIAFHKEQVERLIRDITMVRALQNKFFAGHKNVIPECRIKEQALDKKCRTLLNQGYSIERFLKPSGQGEIFS